MSVLGIICELNPLHLGHVRLLQAARERGADGIVCILSGNSVQRGSLAVTDSYVRADLAVRAGADLVLELPFPWCSASAEGFAMGGVSIAKQFCDGLIFGSETGDLSILKEAAERADTSVFREEYMALLREGEPAAAAYYRLLSKEGLSLSSNDLLGIEYIRAAKRLGAELDFYTVKRDGSAYASTELTEGELPSATALRALLSREGVEALRPYLPEACMSTLLDAKSKGRLACEDGAESAVLAWFRLHVGEDFEGIAGSEGGLAHRFCSVARRVNSLDEFWDAVRTKRYTDAHIRRVLLYCLTGVREEDLSGLPSYTTLLAANETGREILAGQRKNGGFPVITKPADAPKDSRQYGLGSRLDAFYTLSTETPRSADFFKKRSPSIF